jgi:asparagine N-glycosylation enzyme membrane subunit Stt3
MSEDNYIVEERKKKFISFLKNKTLTVYLALLAIIIWISAYIRTRNLPGLKDVTTGGWTLGPDLDPFLFLRWAKHIVENGSLMINDTMRYAPLGYTTTSELNLITYSIAWFHNIINWFGNYTVEYAAVIVPVFIFSLTLIAFFFLVREIFSDTTENKHLPNIIAIAATYLLAVMPIIMPRTIAGIPEKEGLGFLFMSLTFYFALKAWKAKNTKGAVIWGVLTGIASGLMSQSWGGVIYIYMTVAIATFMSFMFGSMTRNRFYSYALWIITTLTIFISVTTRATLSGVLGSTSTGLALGVLGILAVDFLLYETKLRVRIVEKAKTRVPRQVLSIIIAIIIGIVLTTIIFGPSFITNLVSSTYKSLLYPYSDRLSFTVAENRQPFFTDEWRGSFGPAVGGIPIFFWLFFIGSIYLFYNMTQPLEKRTRMQWTASYTIFLLALIFSKYSSSSTLNGSNAVSKLFYIGSLILLGAVTLYIYWQHHKKGDDSLSRINFSYLLLLSFFLVSIIGARSAIRLMMVLGLPAAIITSYFVIAAAYKALTNKNESTKIYFWIIAGLLILGTFYTMQNYTKTSYYQAGGFVPNAYTQQWQKAMGWVRDNTPTDAVFSHWWDYGYWVQSMGERATMVDGGNAYPYWNHLVGRYALTSTSKNEALELLYTHKVTHFLIDSTDIGKYSAFSNIGSNENYDRASYIPTMGIDARSTQETSNGTTYLYMAGFGLDEDIIYNSSSGKIFLPSGRAGLGGVLLTINNDSIGAPEAVFIDQGIQHKIPLRYVYYKGKLYDFRRGMEAGIFIVPVVSEGAGGIAIDDIGSALYLSPRTINSNLARLYLFGEEGEGFTLAHSEDDFVVAQLKTQQANIKDFVYYNGLRGPIKIWNIDYPQGIKEVPQYLETEYPIKELYIVE